jgi:ribosomal protein S18 acetylase RimI-like enzyme
MNPWIALLASRIDPNLGDPLEECVACLPSSNSCCLTISFVSRVFPEIGRFPNLLKNEGFMLIRTLRHEDLDSLLALYQQLFDSDAPLPAREEVVRVWRSMLENPMLDCLGLELDQRLTASCTLTITPNLTRGARPYGQIENVVTHRDFRRQGLGQRLIRHALRMAWERNCYKVMLMTGRFDVHHLYKMQYPFWSHHNALTRSRRALVKMSSAPERGSC